jgi:hypothetical protein
MKRIGFAIVLGCSLGMLISLIYIALVVITA